MRESDFDNDVVSDNFIIKADLSQPFRGTEQLGLQRDRLGYLLKKEDVVSAVVLPATAEDGFNGFVDLLIAINQFGRIEAASVVEDFEEPQSVGLIQLIQSAWFDTFTQKTLRDVRMLSLKPISSENEYDQFVGASITPNLVADRVYDTLVFYQTNRIALTSYAEQELQR
ncbi:MAG: hypothetical protein DHS20C12_28030 [Pseudohongiella sp.]|nr:MAG: hypothetical protein DHS20C12_28030 [Pseudohongiella sp.]